MRRTPRFQSRELTPTERRVYGAATIYFIVAAAAMMWPVYGLFSRVRPLLLGMPLSLFYLAVILVISFLVAVSLYSWEVRRGAFDEPEDAEHER